MWLVGNNNHREWEHTRHACAQCHYLRITILTKVRISFIITKCIVILAKARTFCPLNLMTLRVR
jgi:hypothetical protein